MNNTKKKYLFPSKKGEKIISDILKKHNITLSFLENRGRVYYILHGEAETCENCKFAPCCLDIPVLRSTWEIEQIRSGVMNSFLKIGCLWKYLPK